MQSIKLLVHKCLKYSKINKTNRAVHCDEKHAEGLMVSFEWFTYPKASRKIRFATHAIPCANTSSLLWRSNERNLLTTGISTSLYCLLTPILPSESLGADPSPSRKKSNQPLPLPNHTQYDPHSNLPTGSSFKTATMWSMNSKLTFRWAKSPHGSIFLHTNIQEPIHVQTLNLCISAQKWEAGRYRSFDTVFAQLLMLRPLM